jgi:glucose uptake protein GlcU
MMPIVLAVSFVGASILGVAALGAPSTTAAKVLGGSALALLIFVAVVV